MEGERHLDAARAAPDDRQAHGPVTAGRRQAPPLERGLRSLDAAAGWSSRGPRLRERTVRPDRRPRRARGRRTEASPPPSPRRVRRGVDRARAAAWMTRAPTRPASPGGRWPDPPRCTCPAGIPAPCRNSGASRDGDTSVTSTAARGRAARSARTWRWAWPPPTRTSRLTAGSGAVDPGDPALVASGRAAQDGPGGRCSPNQSRRIRNRARRWRGRPERESSWSSSGNRTKRTVRLSFLSAT